MEYGWLLVNKDDRLAPEEPVLTGWIAGLFILTDTVVLSLICAILFNLIITTKKYQNDNDNDKHSTTTSAVHQSRIQ